MAPRGLGRHVNRVVRHGGGEVEADEGIVFAVMCDRCKGVRGKSMGVRECGREWDGSIVQGERREICEW